MKKRNLNKTNDDAYDPKSHQNPNVTIGYIEYSISAKKLFFNKSTNEESILHKGNELVNSADCTEITELVDKLIESGTDLNCLLFNPENGNYAVFPGLAMVKWQKSVVFRSTLFH